MRRAPPWSARPIRRASRAGRSSRRRATWLATQNPAVQGQTSAPQARPGGAGSRRSLMRSMRRQGDPGFGDHESDGGRATATPDRSHSEHQLLRRSLARRGVTAGCPLLRLKSSSRCDPAERDSSSSVVSFFSDMLLPRPHARPHHAHRAARPTTPAPTQETRPAAQGHRLVDKDADCRRLRRSARASSSAGIPASAWTQIASSRPRSASGASRCPRATRAFARRRRTRG